MPTAGSWCQVSGVSLDGTRNLPSSSTLQEQREGPLDKSLGFPYAEHRTLPGIDGLCQSRLTSGAIYFPFDSQGYQILKLKGTEVILLWYKCANGPLLSQLLHY